MAIAACVCRSPKKTQATRVCHTPPSRARIVAAAADAAAVAGSAGTEVPIADDGYRIERE
jgi:hypothetical protein